MPIIEDSILDTYSMRGIYFSTPLNAFKNFASGELDVSVTSHFYWLLGV